MRPVVAILGGGVAGAATAFHLARALRGKRADIVVVEPRPVLGHGLAYSTTDPAHRTNVPASRMSLIREDPGHFMAWLASTRAMLSPGTLTLSGEFYPERQVFGGYVAAQLEPFLADGAIRHLRAAAVSATRAGDRFRIELSDGGVLRADVAVLAMSHPCPALPDELRALSGSRRLIADPCDAAAIAGIGPAERLLIVGTGLTSADVVASLKLRGFWGEIVALSRHGLRPRGHCAVRIRCDVDFTVPPAAVRPRAPAPRPCDDRRRRRAGEELALHDGPRARTRSGAVADPRRDRARPPRAPPPAVLGRAPVPRLAAGRGGARPRSRRRKARLCRGASRPRHRGRGRHPGRIPAPGPGRGRRRSLRHRGGDDRTGAPRRPADEPGADDDGPTRPGTP